MPDVAERNSDSWILFHESLHTAQLRARGQGGGRHLTAKRMSCVKIAHLKARSVSSDESEKKLRLFLVLSAVKQKISCDLDIRKLDSHA